MITLKGSRFMVSYDENSGGHSVFVKDKDSCNDVTDSLSDEEKEELINDLVYCLTDLLKTMGEE